MNNEPRLTILVNDRVRMSRGKYAAQAVHAALIAAGVHHGGSVVVLGGSAQEIGKCQIQVRDAGRTEVDSGTLTAGIATDPFTMTDATEYECQLIGCDFVGTKGECIGHQEAMDGHDYFASVPSWEELAGEVKR